MAMGMERGDRGDRVLESKVLGIFTMRWDSEEDWTVRLSGLLVLWVLGTPPLHSFYSVDHGQGLYS